MINKSLESIGFVVLLLLSIMMAKNEAWIPSLIIFLTSSLFFFPITYKIRERFSVWIPSSVRIILSIVIVFLSINLKASNDEDAMKIEMKNLSEQRAVKTKKRIEMLESRRDEDVEKSRRLIENGELSEAKKILDSLYLLKDQEVDGLLAQIVEKKKLSFESSNNYDDTKQKRRVLTAEEKAENRERLRSEYSKRMKSEQDKTLDKRLERQFSMWDGCHTMSIQRIKENMHNPDSFELVDCRAFKMGNNRIRNVIDFRGQNPLGATVKHQISTLYTFDGNFIRMW